MMTSVILLFSLFTPSTDGVEHYASELMVPEQTEPRCDELERLLAKFDAEYQVELTTQHIEAIFGE